MEPVLTQEELEAIYAAMQSEGPAAAHINDFELTGGHSFAKKAEARWTECGKEMTGRIESILTGALGRRVRAEVLDALVLEDNIPGDYGDDMPDGMAKPSAIDEDTSVVFSFSVGTAPALVGVDKMVARRFVDRRTGAILLEDEDDQDEPSLKALTALEMRLLRDLIADLVEAFGAITPGRPRVAIEEADPRDLWAARPRTPAWMLIRFALTKLPGAGVWFRGPANLLMPMPKRVRELMRAHLTSTPVRVAVELGRFNVSVSQLWQMQPGALIQLETVVGDPLRVTVGGLPKLLGEPMVSRGNIAVRIQERIKGRDNK